MHALNKQLFGIGCLVANIIALLARQVIPERFEGNGPLFTGHFGQPAFGNLLRPFGVVIAEHFFIAAQLFFQLGPLITLGQRLDF